MREKKKIWLVLFLFNPFLFRLKAQVLERYAIVIDEVLTDPNPVVGLPNYEFIELKNTSAVAWDLFHWKISDGSSTSTISIHYFLQPDSFVVICPLAAVGPFSAFGAALGVSSFPSLNNEEDVISLYSSDGKLIHALSYHLNWFSNAIKSEGGWTLEMIDTGNPCAGHSNWKASSDASGGTPGKKNSCDAINPDQNPPVLSRLYVMDSVTVVAVFDESLDSNEAAIPGHYVMEEIGAVPFRVWVMPPLFNEVQLSFDKPLLPGRIYQLKLSGIKDCSQNAGAGIARKPVGIPSEADSLDMVINELLFNPKDEGMDYVELFNRSNNVIEASRIYIANRNSSGQISPPKKISEVPFLIFPGDYITISEDVANLQGQFVVKRQDWLLQMSTLPSLPDDRGDLIIFNQQGKTVDEVKYDEGWHFPLLHNKEGIALERIDPGKPTQSKDNWTSASSASGYGTPTYRNSQYKETGNSNGTISVVPLLFSPDNDGLDDFCFIHYEMNEPNYVANIFIFDLNGRLLRRLYNNATLSQRGDLRWDGLGEGGRSLSAGIYVIYTEVFNLEGKSKRFKNVVTLAKKF